MTDTAGTFSDVASFDGLRLSQGFFYRAFLATLVLALGAVVAALIVLAFATHPNVDEKRVTAPPAIVLANPFGALAGARHSPDLPPILSDPGIALDLFFDGDTSPPSTAAAPGTDIAPPQPAPEPVQSVPLPPSRPPLFRPPSNREASRPSTRHAIMQTAAPAASPAAPDNRNFFQKLFDLPPQSQNSVLAYAQPEDGGIGGLPAYSHAGAMPGYDRYTAVYDVEAHTVYMPNGDRLEAHSGIGDMLDDPRHVSAKDRGATPPHIYDLELRKTLFHGVQALRLDPVGDGNMYGRTGLLAHTYMLGPKGDSNGCVSFRDYSKFLEAYQNGEVKHLVVVAHLS